MNGEPVRKKRGTSTKGLKSEKNEDVREGDERGMEEGRRTSATKLASKRGFIRFSRVEEDGRRVVFSGRVTCVRRH